MQFLKTLLAVLIGLTLFCLGLIIVGSIVLNSLSEKEKVIVKDNSVLRISLNAPITDREIEDPFSDIPIFADQKTIGLVQVHESIMHAKEDDNIKGILLNAPVIEGGFAKVEQIRRDLEDFKTSGKFVISYANSYSEGGYYLSSIADKVFLNPEGMFEFNGLSSNPIFFKGLFDKLEIEPQIFRVGEYKGAVEPFFRKDLSEENEYQIKELLTSINDNVIEKISNSRSIEIGLLHEISNQMKAGNGWEAVEHDLIDSLLYIDQVFDYLNDKLGNDKGDKINFISYRDYQSTFSNYSSSSNEIAVITGEGTIVVDGDKDVISGVKYSKEIRKAREDEKVKAIVIRINSPGGQLQGADLIWREVELAKKVKPVIASFSDLSASGGYYMAMGADEIYAEPNTITGSIGIFGILINMGDFLDKKLGITTDEVSTGEYSGMLTVTRALTENERAFFQQSINKGYKTFTTKVSEGRGLTMEQVEAIASGRVWSGEQAMEIKLIDKYGGLFDAIQGAADKAGLEDYKVTYYPHKKTILEELMDPTGNQSRILSEELGDNYRYIHQARNIIKYQGIQALFPLDINIH